MQATEWWDWLIRDGGPVPRTFYPATRHLHGDPYFTTLIFDLKWIPDPPAYPDEEVIIALIEQPYRLVTVEGTLRTSRTFCEVAVSGWDEAPNWGCYVPSYPSNILVRDVPFEEELSVIEAGSAAGPA